MKNKNFRTFFDTYRLLFYYAKKRLGEKASLIHFISIYKTTNIAPLPKYLVRFALLDIEKRGLLNQEEVMMAIQHYDLGLRGYEVQTQFLHSAGWDMRAIDAW